MPRLRPVDPRGFISHNQPVSVRFVFVVPGDVMMVEFGKRVLMVGFGSVAQCTLPILLKHLKVKPAGVTVMDFEDRSAQLKPWTEQGVRFVREKITPENLGDVLGKHLADGDLLIDLAWNIDCCELLEWCRDKGVLYLNTSVEVWDPYDHKLY